MAAPSPRSGLPQGFSVYQPALGAPLQFFPALGSAQLDELIGAYVAGPAAVQDKRASVSVDFLAHAQRTGQSFKFYPVQAAAESPLAASPSLDSASSSSSFNVSPVTSSWDWSATASVSSRSSARRARRPASPPRHQPPVDFSHLPGMKILTKDGLDVTNSASRGSKTKEQRDHAHLMRIIKACDSCRRKKIRCDPSHKKRAPAQPPLSAATGSRPSRKPRTTSTTTTTPREQAAPPPSQPPQPSAQDHCAQTALESTDFEALLTPSLHFDPAFSSSLAGLESWDPSAAAVADDAWEEFLQFPPMDASPDYDLYIDPDTYFSSHSSSVQSSSASPLKPMTPQTQDEPGAPPGFDAFDVDGLQKAASTYPFLDPSVPASDYTDFNLFSPASSFSEDERMLPIGTSLSQMPELARSTSSDGVVPDYGGLGFGRSLSESSEASSRPDMPLLDGGDGGCGLANYSAFDPAALHNTEPGPQPAWAGTLSSSSESPHDQVILLCPPGTVVLSAQGSGRVPTKASPSLDHPGCGADPGDSNKPIAECAPGVPAGHVDAPAVGLRSELPAVVAPHDLVAARAASDPRHGLPDVRQAVLQDGLGRQQPADHGIRASTPETKRLQNSASQDRIA
ncbi:hypothetical protein CDD83_2770 [Cordyceps sp. RAO-2017]|nr:hypothetical protein CDD83_2770 [Cordyceps sp. RAO-2017]